jgi:SAM-dependent methyltransferase
MEFFEFFNISERYIELINPTTPEKILHLGRVLGLNPESQVIDFGCGYAEPLVLWAERFGIRGVGIEIRQPVCRRAEEKILNRGLADRLQIVCADGAAYDFQAGAFDVAACIGASFIWKGFRPTVQALKTAIKPEGRLAVGEVYWLFDEVPAECRQIQEVEHTEYELAAIAREEGFDLEYVIRASQDDWDRYEAANWLGLSAWLHENPDHPERREVLAWLRKTQDNYCKCERPYMGWAMYVLRPNLAGD